MKVLVPKKAEVPRLAVKKSSAKKGPDNKSANEKATVVLDAVERVSMEMPILPTLLLRKL